MLKCLIVALMCISACLAYHNYQIIEDAQGQKYYLLSTRQNFQEDTQHGRFRRQAATSAKIGSEGIGVQHTGTIINTDRNLLSGTAFATKDFQDRGRLTTGGSLDYLHKPTDSKFSVGAQNTRGMGTDLSASGNYNFYRSPNGRTTAGIEGQYSRHYGGPWGNSRPNYGAFLNFRHRF